MRIGVIDQAKLLFVEYKSTKDVVKRQKILLKLLPMVVQIWIDILRSEKFTQSFGYLKDFDKKDCFCALGVLSEVFDGIPTYTKVLSLFSEAMIESIISMNDEEKKSFEEIAVFLEKTFLKKGAE